MAHARAAVASGCLSASGFLLALVLHAPQGRSGDRRQEMVWSFAPVPSDAGGKSGLHRAECRVTPGEGNLEESATENRPPCLLRPAW